MPTQFYRRMSPHLLESDIMQLDNFYVDDTLPLSTVDQVIR